MSMYCGKLYANLKMFAGLHLWHPLYPNLIVCLAVESKSEFRKSLIWISKPLNGKAVIGNEPKGFFLSITHYLWARYFTSNSYSSAKQSPRQDCGCTVSSLVWLCTAFLLPATLPPNHCCKSQCLLASVLLLKECLFWKLNQPNIQLLLLKNPVKTTLSQWLKGATSSVSIDNIFI